MEMSTKEQLSALEKALGVLRVPAAPGEYDLHRMIGKALQASGIEYRHEVSLGPRCRIDFLAGTVGIEVKKGAVSPRQLKAQAARYLRAPVLSALLLVVAGGAALPGEIQGKPVVVFGLNRLWGVSLP